MDNQETKPGGIWRKLKDHLFQIILGLLVTLLTFLSNWAWDTVIKTADEVARLKSIVQDLERDNKIMWDMVKSMSDRLNEARIDLKVLEKLYGIHDTSKSGQRDQDAIKRAVLDAIKRDPDASMTPEQYRIMEQKRAPVMKK